MTTDVPARDARFTILMDGDLTPTERLRSQVAGTRVIAADGGMRHASPLGLEPEIWVGDFDSTPDELLDGNGHVPRQDFPARKAISDGELAVTRALEAGARSLVLCGAMGGTRSDHMLFHIMLALRLAHEKGIEVLLTSGTEEAMPLLPGKPASPDWPAGTLFSVIPFSPLSGLTIERADWPLDAVEVEMGSSLTLSNVSADGLRIILGSGTAALVASFDV